jgi:acetylornithine/succinyldiaminopimelate/putrescine aminotransferase
MSTSHRTIDSAQMATLYNADGSTHVDLFGANGTLLLGHSNPSIVEALVAQARKTWITGRLDTPARLEAYSLVNAVLAERLRVAGFYSTGMEAAEFALRAARVITGRKDFVGFAKCMHGKSIATAGLAWESPFGHDPAGVKRVAFPTADNVDEVLGELSSILRQRTTAAVFLEAIQGSGGGASVSEQFCRSIRELCTENQTLLVADEILTGFHRTGPLFFHDRFSLKPDVVIAGKCMGNGFPVSAVLMRPEYEITPQMLPFSTYSENALAMAAVVGTLREIERLPVERLAADIERRIRKHLEPFASGQIRLTVFGAMCIVDVADGELAKRIADLCYERGVLISQAGPMLRLLPPLTIDEQQLEHGLATLTGVMEEVLATSGDAATPS